MALPAGSFGGAKEPEWVSWVPLSIGIAGLALIYLMRRSRTQAQAPSTQGLGCAPGCDCIPR